MRSNICCLSDRCGHVEVWLPGYRGALSEHPLDHRLDLLSSGLPPSSEREVRSEGNRREGEGFMRQRSHVSSLKRAVVAMATGLLLLLFWNAENDFSCGWLLEAQSPFSIPHSPKWSAIVTFAADAHPSLRSTNGKSTKSKPPLNGWIVELHCSQRVLNKTLLNNSFKLAVEKTINFTYIDIGVILDEMDLVVKGGEVHL